MTLPGSPELVLSFLIACSIKATLLLAFIVGTAYALRHRSAAVRHQVWALGIVSSLALPLLTLLLPSWHSTRLNSVAVLWEPVHAGSGNTTIQGPPSMMVNALTGSALSGKLVILILLLWALGALFIVVKLLGGLTRLAWVSGRSRVVVESDWTETVAGICKSHGIARPVRVLQSADVAAMPMTWGIVRPRILVPAGAMEWFADRRRAVLSHELAHIARHDWLMQMCAEMARGFYWFHPLAWFAAAELRAESERACDDSVLNSGVDPSHYASQLLELARTLKNAHRGWSTAVAIARPTNLERRFIAMLNPKLNRGGISRRTGLLLKLVAFCLILPLAAVRLPGQDLSGKFTGTVLDPSGGAVQNATIVMTNHKTNTIDMTTSNASGNFAFKALPAGEYEMKVFKPGFAVHNSVLPLQPAHDLGATVTLEIQGINETADVQAEYRGQPYAMKASPSTETTAESKRVRIGGNVQAAKIVTKVQPIYPESSKAAGVQGSVLLHAVIGKDGTPHSLEVLNGQIDPDLARAAVEAVNQWRYQPTLLNGEPVEIDTTIQINFTLHQ